MILALLRGSLRVISASSGLLLVYGIVFAMDGMTTRLPVGSAKELLMTTVFILPWALLFCSGFDDYGEVLDRDWLFWIGAALIFAFLFYYERHTTSSSLTKALMPPLACTGAVLPHVFRRLSVLYKACSLLVAVCGLATLYFVFSPLLSGSRFANATIAALFVAFSISSLGAGALSLTNPRPRTS